MLQMVFFHEIVLGLSIEREAHASRICNRGRSGDTTEPRTRSIAPCISPIFHAEAKVLSFLTC